MNKQTVKTQKINTNKNLGGTTMRIKTEDLKLNGKEIFDKYGMLSNEEKKVLDSYTKTIYYEWYKDEIYVSHKNAKVLAMILDMPAGISCDPKCPCFKFCYAQKGQQAFCSAKGAHRRNLRLFMENAEDFWAQVSKKIGKKIKWFRFHAAGDIPNAQYLKGMCSLAKKFPDVKFLAYTKKYSLVNNYLDHHRKPSNLTFVFSAWDKTWKVPNPHHMPMAYVNFKDKSINPDIPKKAFKCPGKCEECGYHCWKMNKDQSVVFHQH